MGNTTGTLTFISNPSSEGEQPPVVEGKTETPLNEELETTGDDTPIQSNANDGGEESETKTNPNSDEEQEPNKGAEAATPSWIESHNLTEEEYTKQKEELETLRSRSSLFEEIEVDDFVKGYNEHLKNGGKPEEYIQKQAKILALDFDKMPQIDAVRQAYILQKIDRGMTQQEAEAKWLRHKEEKFDIYDEDSDDWKLEVKDAYLDAKPTLESYKKKLATPITPPNEPQPLTPEQVAAQEKANKEFVAKYNKEQSLDFDFKVGDKVMPLKHKGNLYANFQKELESSDLMASYRKEDGSVDEDKFLRAMYVAKNADKLFQLAYEQGATDFEANKLEEARNPKEKDSANVPTSSILENNLNSLRNAFSKKG